MAYRNPQSSVRDQRSILELRDRSDEDRRLRILCRAVLSGGKVTRLTVIYPNLRQIAIIFAVAMAFPLWAAVYLVAPKSRIASFVRKPFVKFLAHSGSYLFFLCKYTVYI